ncbi:MAG: FG-GAP repeat domain-containing protein, partial [Bryobacteraceae bacterium]
MSTLMPARTFSFLLAAAFAGCLGAHAAVPAPALPHLTGPLPGSSWVIADFDGDGRPDVLISTVDRRGAAEYRHRVDLRIGLEAEAHSSFQVVGSSRGLNLFARDVDGDHDLDVVITSVFSDAPVGVWINDGDGVFTEGDSSA